MSRTSSHQPQDHFIRLQEVLYRIGISRSNLYKLMEMGKFPAQIKIGYSSVWSHNAVNQWMAEQIALSQSQSSSQQSSENQQAVSHAIK